jgi:tetratricopeptide (TPR) repeat protein
MTGARWRPRVALLAATTTLLAILPGAPAAAQSAPKTAAGASSGSAEAQAAAHFQHARALYSQGSYREAITELEAALALDPKATDLVFNLGVVNEKLGNIDEALKYYRRYMEMDIDAQQRARAESFIKRLEGAKREVKPEDKGTPVTPEPPPPAEPPPAPQHGRVDVLTITAAVIAVGGLAVGTVYGVKAVTENPSPNGPWPSYSAYQDDNAKAQTAHHEAVAADVGFIVGGVALAATAALYFLRTKSPKQRPTSGTGGGMGVTVSAAPFAGGWSGFVASSF